MNALIPRLTPSHLGMRFGFWLGICLIAYSLPTPGTLLCSQDNAPSQSKQPDNRNQKEVDSKQASSQGVARIHDRDFPVRQISRNKQASVVVGNTAETSPKLSPLPSFESNSIHSNPSLAPPHNIGGQSPNVDATIDEGKRNAEEVQDFSNTRKPDIDSNSILEEDGDVEQSIAEIETQDEESIDNASSQETSNWSFNQMTDRKSLPATIQMFVSIAAISLVPAILLMTTCFIRIVVVLGILRQAIGLQQLPPTQVTTGLALMMTFLVMAPTWKEVKQNAIDPYTAEGSTMTWDDAWDAGVTPVKKFMWSQIRRAENENDFWVFYDYLPEEEKAQEPTSYEEVPLKVLLPAFMISELKVAFLIGIQILLPFLILDIVVASLCNTMGLIMLPPAVVSLPLKLLLFVMVDGWNLVVSMLLNSFALIQV